MLKTECQRERSWDHGHVNELGLPLSCSLLCCFTVSLVTYLGTYFFVYFSGMAG